jgi:hypothetical protein
VGLSQRYPEQGCAGAMSVARDLSVKDSKTDMMIDIEIYRHRDGMR